MVFPKVQITDGMPPIVGRRRAGRPGKMEVKSKSERRNGRSQDLSPNAGELSPVLSKPISRMLAALTPVNDGGR